MLNVYLIVNVMRFNRNPVRVTTLGTCGSTSSLLQRLLPNRGHVDFPSRTGISVQDDTLIISVIGDVEAIPFNPDERALAASGAVQVSVASPTGRTIVEYESTMPSIRGEIVLLEDSQGVRDINVDDPYYIDSNEDVHIIPSTDGIELNISINGISFQVETLEVPNPKPIDTTTVGLQDNIKESRHQFEMPLHIFNGKPLESIKIALDSINNFSNKHIYLTSLELFDGTGRKDAQVLDILQPISDLNLGLGGTYGPYLFSGTNTFSMHGSSEYKVNSVTVNVAGKRAGETADEVSSVEIGDFRGTVHESSSLEDQITVDLGSHSIKTVHMDYDSLFENIDSTSIEFILRNDNGQFLVPRRRIFDSVHYPSNIHIGETLRDGWQFKSKDTYLVEEDFESYPDGSDITSSEYVIEQGDETPQVSSFQIKSLSGTNIAKFSDEDHQNQLNIRRNYGTGSGTLGNYIEINVLINTIVDGNFNALARSDHYGNIYGGVIFNVDGTVNVYDNAGSTNIGTYSLGSWYRVRFVIVDGTHFDIAINGVIYDNSGSHFTVREGNLVTNLLKNWNFYLSNVDGKAEVFLDNFARSWNDDVNPIVPKTIEDGVRIAKLIEDVDDDGVIDSGEDINSNGLLDIFNSVYIGATQEGTCLEYPEIYIPYRATFQGGFGLPASQIGTTVTFSMELRDRADPSYYLVYSLDLTTDVVAKYESIANLLDSANIQAVGDPSITGINNFIGKTVDIILTASSSDPITTGHAHWIDVCLKGWENFVTLSSELPEEIMQKVFSKNMMYMFTYDVEENLGMGFNSDPLTSADQTMNIEIVGDDLKEILNVRNYGITDPGFDQDSGPIQDWEAVKQVFGESYVDGNGNIQPEVGDSGYDSSSYLTMPKEIYEEDGTYIETVYNSFLHFKFDESKIAQVNTPTVYQGEIEFYDVNAVESTIKLQDYTRRITAMVQPAEEVRFFKYYNLNSGESITSPSDLNIRVNKHGYNTSDFKDQIVLSYQKPVSNDDRIIDNWGEAIQTKTDDWVIANLDTYGEMSIDNYAFNYSWELFDWTVPGETNREVQYDALYDSGSMVVNHTEFEFSPIEYQGNTYWEYLYGADLDLGNYQAIGYELGFNDSENVNDVTITVDLNQGDSLVFTDDLIPSSGILRAIHDISVASGTTISKINFKATLKEPYEDGYGLGITFKKLFFEDKISFADDSKLGINWEFNGIEEFRIPITPGKPHEWTELKIDVPETDNGQIYNDLIDQIVLSSPTNRELKVQSIAMKTVLETNPDRQLYTNYNYKFDDDARAMAESMTFMADADLPAEWKTGIDPAAGTPLYDDHFLAEEWAYNHVIDSDLDGVIDIITSVHSPRGEQVWEVDNSLPLAYNLSVDCNEIVYDYDGNADGNHEFSWIISEYSQIQTFKSNTRAVMKETTYIESFIDNDENGVYEIVYWDILTNISNEVLVDQIRYWDGSEFTYLTWDYTGKESSLVYGNKFDRDQNGVYELEYEYYDLWDDVEDPAEDPTFETVQETHRWEDYGNSIYNVRNSDPVLCGWIGQTFVLEQDSISRVGIGITELDSLNFADKNRLESQKPDHVTVSINDKDDSGNYIALSTVDVPFSSWNSADDAGFTWVDLIAENMEVGKEYTLIIDPGENNLVAVNQSLDGYEDGNMVCDPDIKPDYPSFFQASRDINFFIDTNNFDIVNIDNFNLVEGIHTPNATTISSDYWIMQNFVASTGHELKSVQVYIPESTWDTEYQAGGEWLIEFGNASGILSNETYKFNVPYSVTEGWLEVPLICSNLVEGDQYWFNISQADASVSRPIAVEANDGGYAQAFASKGTSESTSQDLGTLDTYFRVETEKEDEDAYINEVSFSYNTLVTEEEFYVMGADDFQTDTYTKITENVLVESGVPAVIDPRLSLPDNLRLDTNATIYWTDMDGDGIYEGGFVFSSDILYYDGIEETFTKTCDDQLPVAIGYFLDYNGNGEFDTDRRHYRDGNFGDRFFPFYWLSDYNEFIRFRQESYDDANDDFVAQTFSDPMWWVEQAINVLVDAAIMIVSGLCGPFSFVVSMGLHLLWSFARSALHVGLMWLFHRDKMVAMQHARAIEIQRMEGFSIKDNKPYPNTNQQAYGKFGHISMAIPKMSFEIVRHQGVTQIGRASCRERVCHRV